MTDESAFELAADPAGLRQFVEEIERAGFERVDTSTWEGPIRQCLVDAGHTEAERMQIIIRPAWPYLPPLLHVPGISAWHADQERLCIWHGEDGSQRWVTLRGIHERIDEWVAHASDGFAAVENARNPEIYWQQPMAGLAAGLADLEAIVGPDPDDGAKGEFHFAEAVSADGRPSPASVFQLERGAFRSRSRLPLGAPDHRCVRGRWLFRSSVPNPPRSVEELRSFLTSEQRQRLDRDLQTRQLVMYGLVWRNQAGLVATVVLSMASDQTQSRTEWRIALRPSGKQEMLLRAGPDADLLQGQSVTVLGVGAIGSHVADQLARSGVGRLRLVDYDLLWPANLIRHAASPGTPAGTAKVNALRDQLTQYPWVDVEAVDVIVWSPQVLSELLASSDLLVDASGHVGLSEYAGRVAHDLGRPLVSVALFRGGAVARIRRQALYSDVPLVRRPHLDRYPQITPLADEVEFVGTETGCLAMIHNAPPVAVARAATIAAEVVIDHLSGRHDHGDEVLEVLRVTEPPFERLGRVRQEELPRVMDITEASHDRLRHLAQEALPLEAGGVMLGGFVDGRPVVSEIVPIFDATATPGSYSISRDGATEAVLAARRADADVGYLGEWHSHPSGGGPSPRDVAALLALSGPDGNSDVDEPLLVIVDPSDGPRGAVAAFAAVDGRMRPVEVCLVGGLDPEQEHQ